MDWDFIDKRQGGRQNRPDSWNSIPGLSVSKSGLTLNQEFVETFGIKSGSYVRIGFPPANSTQRGVGIKVIPNGESIERAYKVGQQSHGGQRPSDKVLTIHCNRIFKLFPDCTRRCYRAHLNPGERVIEVSFSPENVMK